MNQSFLLWRLQKIDTTIDQARARSKEIDSLIESNQTIAEAAKRLAQSEQTLKIDRINLKRIEDMVTAQHIKIETNESSLYGGRINNPKELKDLQNEVASLKRYISELEEQQFEAMVRFEQSEKEVDEAKKSQASVLAVFTSQSASLMGEKSSLAMRIDNLDAERKTILPAIEPQNLQIYQQLREQKRGIAVASVEENACKACGSDLRPAEWQAARSPHSIAYCSSCGRILYAG